MSEIPKRRLFVAVELPDRWRDEASRIRREVEPVAGGELRWVRPDLLHLTVVFLGYQGEESVPTIERALESAAMEITSFRMGLGRPGCFGQPRNLRTIWLGLADVPSELQQLHRAASERLAEGEIAFDRKPLAPHITLARARPTLRSQASLQIHAKLAGTKANAVLPLKVTEFVLMESHLSPKGPEYQVARAFSLR